MTHSAHVSQPNHYNNNNEILNWDNEYRLHVQLCIPYLSISICNRVINALNGECWKINIQLLQFTKSIPFDSIMTILSFAYLYILLYVLCLMSHMFHSSILWGWTKHSRIETVSTTTAERRKKNTHRHMLLVGGCCASEQFACFKWFP